MKLPKKLQDKKDAAIIAEKLPLADEEQIYGKGYNQCWADVSEAMRNLVEALMHVSRRGADFTERLDVTADEALERWEETIGSESE